MGLGLHGAWVEPVFMGYRATCPCGWRGERRGSSKDALADADKHSEGQR